VFVFSGREETYKPKRLENEQEEELKGDGYRYRRVKLYLQPLLHLSPRETFLSIEHIAITNVSFKTVFREFREFVAEGDRTGREQEES
jgi:hypothetical protein